MAYAKVAKVVADFALGKQTWNKIVANADAVNALYDAEHYNPPQLMALTNGVKAPPANGHWHPRIPKSVAYIDVNATTLVSGQSSITWAVKLKNWMPISLYRFNPGTWVLTFQGRANIWATASPIGTTTARHINVRPVTGAAWPALGFLTYELVGGMFTPADYDFSIGVWSE
jgi:hypothetical protein